MKVGKDYIGVGGGVLIFNDKEQVLLLKRTSRSKNEAGYWSKPGGQVDFGETAIVAIKREILEETNLEIRLWGLLPHTDHIIKEGEQHWVAINYLGKALSNDFKVMEPEKCAEMKWFDLEKLPTKLTQTTRESVENYLKGKYIRF